jgi:hypothetical protein
MIISLTNIRKYCSQGKWNIAIPCSYTTQNSDESAQEHRDKLVRNTPEKSTQISEELQEEIWVRATGTQ